MEKIRVILADDHDILMDGIEALLQEGSHIKVVGKATDTTAAEALIRQHQPDLLLTDISMGASSGLDLTRTITREFPLVKVIVLSMHDHVEHIRSMMEVGALGYLLKNVKQDELFLAIAQVMTGQQYIQQSLAGKYVREQAGGQRQDILSQREKEIIRLIARELTTTEISQQLFLSTHTVETHRKNIARKTGVKSVVGLLNYAREHGIL